MKIQLKSFSFFPARKNVFFAFFFVFICFFFVFSYVQAGDDDPPCDTGCKMNGGRPVGTMPTVSGFVNEKVSDGFLWIATGVLDVESALANAAAILFVWMLDPTSFDKIMNHNPAVYDIWKIVRDTMNMLFILVLLFSAFATIYQIDKYKWNKILLTVIIMALLVNFSWPIARAIVDFFNSMMYFFVQSLFHTDGQAAVKNLLGGADMGHIFLPENQRTDWRSVLLAIITMFIFMCTLLVLSLMMLIRLIALPILVMFSPLGFAGMVAPFTQTYAKQWWDKLFKYASYGPIAVFMVLVGVRVMQHMGEWKTGVKAISVGMSANKVDGDVLAALVNFAVPVVLMWIALTSAEKMSGELSGTTIKFGSNLAKWGGKKFSGYNRGKAFYSAWDGARKQARSDAEARSWMTRLGKGTARKQDQLSAAVGPTSGMRNDARIRLENEDAARVKASAEKKKTEEQSVEELNKLATTGNKFEKAAAILELASRGVATRSHLNDISNSFGEGSSVDRQLRGKMKAYDPVTAFTYKNGLNQSRLEGFVKSNQFDVKKLGADSLEDADLMGLLFENNLMSTKDLDDMRNKSEVHRKNIETSLTALTGKYKDSTNESHQRMQQAYLAQTGKFSAAAAADAAWKVNLLQYADKDVLKRINATFVTSNQALIAANVKQKNYKAIITDMNDGAAAVQLNNYIRTTGATAAAGSNENRLSNMVSRDPQLQGYV